MSKRESIHPDIQQKVRQKARFKCQAEDDDRITLKQYAHIVPDVDGGPANINNLLWLCESCHRRYEAQGKSGLLRKSIVKNLEEFRDKPIIDSMVDGLFDELIAHPDHPIDIILGNVRFRNLQTIFSEPINSYRPSFLRFYRDKYRLRLAGHLKDINGFTLIEFDGDSLHFHTRDIWDIERRARYLKIYSKSQKVWIEIVQKNDLSVIINGEIYAGGKIISINKSGGVQFPNGGGIQSLTIDGSHNQAVVGIGLPASPTPRPYGHINPNVPE